TTEDRVADAVRLMRERQIRHLPVVEPNTLRLVGILSDRDVRWLLGQNLHADNRVAADSMADAVGEVMTRQPVTVHDDAPVLTAVDLTVVRRIGALPVLGGAGALTGFATDGDGVRACRERLNKAETAR